MDYILALVYLVHLLQIVILLKIVDEILHEYHGGGAIHLILLDVVVKCGDWLYHWIWYEIQGCVMVGVDA